MRKLLLIAAVVSFPVLADTYVPSYTRADGTFVQGYYKTSPNSTKADNYSTLGNTNPYTSQRGTVDPYKIETPKAYSPPPTSTVKPYEPYTPYKSQY